MMTSIFSRLRSSAACTASTEEPYPARTLTSAAVTERAPEEMIGTWQFTSLQGSASSWTFRSDGTAIHSVAVISGPSECRRSATTVYEGPLQITDRTLEYTATRATETIVDCTGTTSAPADGYAETLTYEIVSPTELVIREVSKCQQTDRAPKEAFCRTTFARR